MKKKIALLLVMMLCFFSVIRSMSTVEVNADAEDVTLVSSPSPHP
jgi:hypothetical protein